SVCARQLSRPAQRVLVSCDEVGEALAWLLGAGVEPGEALLPSAAELLRQLGRPRFGVFHGPGRSTLRVVCKSRSRRRLSTSSCFTFCSSCRIRVVVSGGRPGDAPGSIASKIASSAFSSSW